MRRQNYFRFIVRIQRLAQGCSELARKPLIELPKQPLVVIGKMAQTDFCNCSHILDATQKQFRFNTSGSGCNI